MGGGHLSRPDFGMPQPNPDHPLTEFYQLLQRGLDREGVFALPALYAAFQAPARRIYADEAADYLTLSETPAENRTLLLPPRMLQILYSSLHVLPDGTPAALLLTEECSRTVYAVQLQPPFVWEDPLPPLPDCAAALKTASGVKGRVEVVPTDGDYTILIDYAHTPDALENVLKSMRRVAKGRLVALFGCGGDRDRTKRPIMGRIAAENADFVVVTSDNPRTEQPEAIIADIVAGMEGTSTPREVITGRPEAIEWAITNHQPGDVIVLAGKGHEDYQIVGHEKHHMDEREIVAGILEKRKTDR